MEWWRTPGSFGSLLARIVSHRSFRFDAGGSRAVGHSAVVLDGLGQEHSLVLFESDFGSVQRAALAAVLAGVGKVRTLQADAVRLHQSREVLLVA